MNHHQIAIIGLGYVGLPLAVEFGKKVSHSQFLDIDYKALRNDHNAVIFDTKSFLERSLVDARL